MKHPHLVNAVLGIALCGVAAQASAVQFGADYAHTSGHAESNDDGGPTFDLTSDQFGGVLDTGAVGRVFQYRLGIDYIKGKFDDADYHGVAYTNHFGFKLNAPNATSVWIGPTIHIEDLKFDGGDDAFLWAIGPTLGVNLALDGKGKQLLALELGYRKGWLHIDDGSSDFFFNGSSYDTRDFQFKAGLLFGN